MSTAKFITFEGTDGSGKTTQLDQLDQYLAREHNITARVSKEPGGTAAGLTIRQLLLSKETNIDPHTETLLFAADRAQHIAEVIRPTLKMGHWVLSDRFEDSTIAYQGAGRELLDEGGPQAAFVRKASMLARGSMVPDLTILLDVPPEVSTGRRALRGKNDRIEAEDIEFHRRVRDQFLRIAQREPERVVMIDGTSSIDVVHQKVKEAVKTRLL